MKSKQFKWMLGGVAFIILVLPLILYVCQFGSMIWPPRFSNSTSDWANFGTYLSGTVGVFAVVGTLGSVLITLKQQNRMLEHQERERLKNEAYTISTIVFPKVRKRLDDNFKMSIATFFKKHGFDVIVDPVGCCSNDQLMSLFTDCEIGVGFETFEKVFPSEKKGGDGVKAAVLLRIIEYNFKIVEKCIESAPELSSYLYDEELQKAFGCYLAYERGCTGGKTTEFAHKCSIAGFPGVVGDNYGIEKMWYELGKRVIKPAE